MLLFASAKSKQKGTLFSVTFCGVQKVTKKHAGLTPCDLGSKLYTGVLFIEIVAFRV